MSDKHCDTPASPYSFDGPWVGQILEWLAATTVFLTLIAPRGSFLFLALLLLGLLFCVKRQKSSENSEFASPKFSSLSNMLQSQFLPWLAAMLFLFYAAISSIWAHAPLYTVGKLVHASIVFAVFAAAYHFAGSLAPLTRWKVLRGIVHGAVLSLVYIAIEQLTEGGIKTALANNTGLIKFQQSFVLDDAGKVLSIARTFLNRNTAALVVLLWPLFGAAAYWLKPWPRVRLWVLFVFFGVAASLIFVSESETAKFAFVISSLCALMALFNPKLTLRLVQLGWVLASIFIIPLTVFLAAPTASYMKYLPPSAEDRAEIWSFTAARTLNAPIIGVGANMTRYVPLERRAASSPRRYEPRLSFHAHNVFLQTWFELGGVGALLLCLVGLSAIWQLVNVTGFAGVVGQAFAASVASVGLVGYGMWQIWLFGVVLISIVIIRMLSDTQRQE